MWVIIIDSNAFPDSDVRGHMMWGESRVEEGVNGGCLEF